MVSIGYTYRNLVKLNNNGHVIINVGIRDVPLLTGANIIHVHVVSIQKICA